MRRRVAASLSEVRAHGPEPPAHGRDPKRGASRALGATLGLIALGAPVTALAQELWTITPSLTTAEKYTDNVFGTAHNRQSDFITQITPGILISYESPPFKASVGYAATGEIYADNSDLDNFGDNQRGRLTLDYRPEERLGLHLAGFYAKTNNPSELLVPGVAPPGVTPVPTVQTTRTETTQFRISAGADYRFTERFSGNAGYTYSLLEQQHTQNSQSHTGTLGGTYELTRQDQGFSTVSGSYFDDGNSDTSASLLLGWRRKWAPDFTTSVAAGPRVSNGDVWNAAVEASATYLPERQWSVTLSYRYDTSLAAGTTGAQNVSSLTAAVGYRATQELSFGAHASWYRTSPLDGGSTSVTTDTYGVGAVASYQLTRWLTLFLDYQYSLEDPEHRDSIRINQVILGLTASYPYIPGR